jgi:serine/threonine-protein kinase HipA
MITNAFVKIWGELVGAVSWDAKTEVASFQYTKQFMALNIDLSPIKMPLKLGDNVFSFPLLKPKRNSEYNTFKGMPGLLADVLPDKYGNQLINLWLAKNGRPENSMNPVEMLCFIGSRGMGALEFEPSKMPENKRSFNIELESLVNMAQKILNTKTSFHINLNDDEESALIQILKIGTSVGGARPKALIAYNKKTGEVKSGQANAPKGFEHWLLKLDGVSDIQLGSSKGFGRVEMAYYNMALDCGINMMPSLLFEENGRAHFMTQRFDRYGGSTKHHIQTWCALNHFDFNEVTSFSYEQLFETMRTLKLDYPSAEQLYRRMVFNVLARNCDDHTKNFSFILKQGLTWQLAPAYDICHSYAPESKWVSQHALSINGKRSEILKEDLLAVAKAMNIKKAETIIQQINNVVKNWNNYAIEVKVNKKLTEAIAKTLLRFEEA